jgi:hypothetical protein
MASIRKTLQEIALKYLALAGNEERSAMMSGLTTDGKQPPDARG